jgi:hypothetical protein
MAPSTIRRPATNLKAALNNGLITHRARVPTDLAPTIRHGLKLPEHQAPVARDTQVLSDGDTAKIIAAASKVDWDGVLIPMVIVLAAAGARFSSGRARISIWEQGHPN